MDTERPNGLLSDWDLSKTKDKVQKTAQNERVVCCRQHTDDVIYRLTTLRLIRGRGPSCLVSRSTTL